jgi:hypothetical protein
MQLRPQGPRNRRLDPSSGFTMAEAVVAVAILGVMAYVGLGMWGNVSSLKAKLNVESDRIDVGLALRERIDCARTIAAFSPSTVCDAATSTSPVAVALKDAADQTLVASSSDYVSNNVTTDYQAKASCYKDGPYFVLNANIRAASQTDPNIKVYKNLGYLCWQTASLPLPPPPPPPPPPTGSCQRIGNTGAFSPPGCDSSCNTATSSIRLCFYNGDSQPAFGLFTTTSTVCAGLTCPGTPSSQTCVTPNCTIQN